MWFSLFIPFIGIFISMTYGVYLLLRRGELLSFFVLLIWARISNPVVFPKSLLFTAVWWMFLYVPLLILTIKKGRIFQNRFFWLV